MIAGRNPLPRGAGAVAAGCLEGSPD